MKKMMVLSLLLAVAVASVVSVAYAQRTVLLSMAESQTSQIIEVDEMFQWQINYSTEVLLSPQEALEKIKAFHFYWGGWDVHRWASDLKSLRVDNNSIFVSWTFFKSFKGIFVCVVEFWDGTSIESRAEIKVAR